MEDKINEQKALEDKLDRVVKTVLYNIAQLEGFYGMKSPGHKEFQAQYDPQGTPFGKAAVDLFLPSHYADIIHSIAVQVTKDNPSDMVHVMNAIFSDIFIKGVYYASINEFPSPEHVAAFMKEEFGIDVGFKRENLQ